MSISDSPFFRLDDSACRFIVSAPSRDAAVVKLMRVRVDASKNATATVLPRSVANFFKRMPLEFLERLRLVQNKSDLLGCEAFDIEHVLQALEHFLPLSISFAVLIWSYIQFRERGRPASRVPRRRFPAGALPRFPCRWFEPSCR